MIHKRRNGSPAVEFWCVNQIKALGWGVLSFSENQIEKMPGLFLCFSKLGVRRGLCDVYTRTHTCRHDVPKTSLQKEEGNKVNTVTQVSGKDGKPLLPPSSTWCPS